MTTMTWSHLWVGGKEPPASVMKVAKRAARSWREGLVKMEVPRGTEQFGRTIPAGLQGKAGSGDQEKTNKC